MIALMVVGFVVFWPLGLAVIAYIIWGERWQEAREARRMGQAPGGFCGRRRGWSRERAPDAEAARREAADVDPIVADPYYRDDVPSGFNAASASDAAFEEYLRGLRAEAANEAEEREEFYDYMDDLRRDGRSRPGDRHVR